MSTVTKDANGSASQATYLVAQLRDGADVGEEFGDESDLKNLPLVGAGNKINPKRIHVFLYSGSGKGFPYGTPLFFFSP